MFKKKIFLMCLTIVVLVKTNAHAAAGAEPQADTEINEVRGDEKTDDAHIDAQVGSVEGEPAPAPAPDPEPDPFLGKEPPFWLEGPDGLVLSYAYPLDYLRYLARQKRSLPLPQFIHNETPDPKVLPPKHPHHVWTVVIDLDETLAHTSKRTGLTRVRPLAKDFLMGLKYDPDLEIVVWTAGIRNHAINVLNAISAGIPGLRIDHLIYRSSAWYPGAGGPTRKDLRLLGRPDVILIENDSNVALNCHGSAILVDDFKGDLEDGQLSTISSLFRRIRLAIDEAKASHRVVPTFSILGVIKFRCPIAECESRTELPPGFLKGILRRENIRSGLEVDIVTVDED